MIPFRCRLTLTQENRLPDWKQVKFGVRRGEKKTCNPRLTTPSKWLEGGGNSCCAISRSKTHLLIAPCSTATRAGTRYSFSLPATRPQRSNCRYAITFLRSVTLRARAASPERKELRNHRCIVHRQEQFVGNGPDHSLAGSCAVREGKDPIPL